ncbi:MAG: 30S ribosomal protein S1, partial [Flavobacteriaceae bacterium]
GNKLKKGESAEFKVIEFNKDYKRVVLSHSAVYKDMEQEIVKKAKKKVAKTEVSTLGDIDALVDLKKKMNKEENG